MSIDNSYQDPSCFNEVLKILRLATVRQQRCVRLLYQPLQIHSFINLARRITEALLKSIRKVRNVIVSDR